MLFLRQNIKVNRKGGRTESKLYIRRQVIMRRYIGKKVENS